jgi:uncharacterized DUF497 family protein
MPGKAVKSDVRVDSFVFDDENEGKIMRHGLTVDQVDQVLGNRHRIVANRKNRRGIVLIVGRDDGGACIAIPAERTYDRSCWRPITAWPCKAHEAAILK